MQIPAFKKIVDSNHLAASLASPKSLPSLEAVLINHSHFGLLFYRCCHCVFALGLMLAFYPFVMAHSLWTIGMVVCWYGLWVVCRRQSNRYVIGYLGFSDDKWLLEQNGCTCSLELAGEVLCWLWLIVLPFRDTTDGKIRHLLLFVDALSKQDNARLRAWLRASLIPKA